VIFNNTVNLFKVLSFPRRVVHFLMLSRADQQLSEARYLIRLILITILIEGFQWDLFIDIIDAFIFKLRSPPQKKTYLCFRYEGKTSGEHNLVILKVPL